MDLKRKMLINQFSSKDVHFKDTKEYLTDCVEKSNLSYEKLKYLYDNLYNSRSFYLQQNLFPVCEFLRKGYSIDECEKLTHYLEDSASAFTEEKNRGRLYNKPYYDLGFAYYTYDKHIKRGNYTNEALRKTLFELSVTDRMEREVEMQLVMSEYIDSQHFNIYQKHLRNNISTIQEKVKTRRNKGIDMYKLNRTKNILYRLKNYMQKQNKGLENIKNNTEFER